MIDLKKLSTAVKGTQLYEFLESVKLGVADIRKSINVKPEIEIDVRKAVCEVIDDMIVRRLKTVDSPDKAGEDTWE